MKKINILYLLLSILTACVTTPEESSRCCLPQEPNVEIAKSWWPDQRNVWTPVGWKDHYFRFNILYNGAILAEPCPHWAPTRPHSLKWLDKDFMLKIAPSIDGNPEELPDKLTSQWRLDGGHGIQGWRTDKQTPVLWTDFPLQEGLVVRQEVFAHIKGARDVETGIEPLYAWIRLSVIHVDELRHPGKFLFSVQLSRNYYVHRERYLQEDGITVDVEPSRVPYPQNLNAESFRENGQVGLRILEPDGKVRLTVQPTDSDKVQFSAFKPGIYNLKVTLKAELGDHVDMLLPMLPDTPGENERECALGFDGALADAEPYWEKTPESSAQVHVPEKYFNRWLSQSLKFAEIIAEKDYLNGEYTFLTGSWGYDNLWSTPTSMTSHMLLSLMGYHDVVAKHIELFRKNQGSVKPPGPSYEVHPGYFSTPKTLTAFDWLTDHGAILHQASMHALLSKDTAFIKKWTESIVKGCDFIQDMCESDHDGIKGLLPPGNATDELFPVQAVWNMAWNYKGLVTAVRFLKQIKHPRAKEFETFAVQFKKTFNDAYRKYAEDGQRWMDSQGNKRYKPPTNLSLMPTPYHSFTEAFYLDTGPMILVWAGLMDANDRIMIDIVDFFREGPNKKLYGTRYHPLCRPYLDHEISTCEPCYSWNVFHAWQLQDRKHYLEGLYGLLLGATSQNTYISCEHRHGIQGVIAVNALAFNLARLAVIDEQITSGELHLLRLCPLAWLSDKEETIFEKMPTEFGPVNLKYKLNADKTTLQVSFSGDWHEQPQRIVLHVPPMQGLSKIVVNGKKYAVKETNQIVVVI
ncbi:MAG: hypothetical protein LBM08_09780 [Dysgonamonadaceae bacterium]|jgi:hypothetical protein|nr:hypothetical protein [Dysgonamonadaceae bacterium]